jgi:hypothetical protein
MVAKATMAGAKRQGAAKPCGDKSLGKKSFMSRLKISGTWISLPGLGLKHAVRGLVLPHFSE